MEISQSEKQKKNEDLWVLKDPGPTKTCGTTCSTPTNMSWESYDMEKTQEKCQKINKKYWMKTFQI